MRKIILIFLVSVSVLFGQEENVQCTISIINPRVNLGEDATNYVHYYPQYNTSSNSIEWKRLHLYQTIYEFDYIKNHSKRIKAYAIFNSNLDIFYIYKFKFYSDVEYSFIETGDFLIDAILGDDGGYYFMKNKSPDLLPATIDERFGDVTFNNYRINFDAYSFAMDTCFTLYNLQRAYKIYKHNQYLPVYTYNLGLIKYTDAKREYDLILSTEDGNGEKLSDERINRINTASRSLIPSFMLDLIYKCGVEDFDSIRESASRFVDFK